MLRDRRPAPEEAVRFSPSSQCRSSTHQNQRRFSDRRCPTIVRIRATMRRRRDRSVPAVPIRRWLMLRRPRHAKQAGALPQIPLLTGGVKQSVSQWGFPKPGARPNRPEKSRNGPKGCRFVIGSGLTASAPETARLHRCAEIHPPVAISRCRLHRQFRQRVHLHRLPVRRPRSNSAICSPNGR